MLQKARAALKAELSSADREDDEDTPEEREDTFRRLGAAPDLAEFENDDFPL